MTNSNKEYQKFGGNRKDKTEIHYYFIYMHINKVNNKKYIGITYQNPPEKRWRKGTSYGKKGNLHFYSAIHKYGWDNFEHIILEEGYFTVKEAGDKEEYYIQKYDTRNQSKGYNIAPGGYRGLSPNAIPALKKWMKEHPEVGLSRAKAMHKWQKDHPEEFKKNCDELQIKGTTARKCPVVCLETQVVYESVTEASRCVKKACQSKITMCCQGCRKTAGGFHWLYLEDFNKLKDVDKYLMGLKNKKTTYGKKRVICLETTEIFESVTQASKIKDLSLYTIAECCRNKSNNYTCGGFHWRYLDE